MVKNKENFILRLLIFEIIFIVFLSIFYQYISSIQAKKVAIEFSAKEQVKIKNLKNMLINYFEMTWSNIKVLSSSEEMRSFVKNEKHTLNRKILEKSLKPWLLFNEFYEDISIIKNNGAEIMRINYNNGFPLEVLDVNLKDNSEAEYFEDLRKLDKNSIYMKDIFTSENDTANNVETKFVTALNVEDKRVGFLKLTIENSKIIRELIKQLEIEKDIKIFILDNNGRKIYGNINNESKEEVNDFSEKLTQLKKENKNQIKNKMGMIFFESLNINERNLEEKTGVTIITDENEDCYWQLFIIVPQNVLDEHFVGKTSVIRIIYYTSMLIGIIIIYLLYFILHKKNAAENELKISGEVFDNAKEGILISDSGKEIKYVNNSFLKMMNYSKEEVVGKKISSIKSNKHPKEFYAKMWDVINRYGKWQGEIWGKKKDGEFFPVWLTISKVNINKKETRYFAIYDDLSILKRNEDNIRNLMDFDFITHLPNKFLFMDRLQQLMSQARILQENFTVFSLSISNLKEINANYGMDIGDRFLKEIALLINDKLLPADTLAKFEGSNLYILFPEIQSPAKALEKAEEILSISKTSFKINNHEILAYLNIGIIVYPDNGDTIPELMKNLGLALNVSKQDGGNNYKFYSNKVHNLAVERSEMDVLLRRAIENKEFYLNYQPQIDVKTGEIVGAEALIRWQHPVLGLVTPVKFISIAEENRFINTIGEWVLKEACTQNKVWQFKGYKKLVIAVNISPIQFAQDDFVALLKRVLVDTGLPAKYLEIELTEGMMISDMDTVMKKLKEIKNLGVKISIDDFGTGYSSLSYIKKFPIDKIKIDRIFIKDYPNSDDGRIAKTIVQLGHNLNHIVIAEGAETKEQYEYLKSIKCNEIQGYYFSKPLLASELEGKYLNNNKSNAATQNS